MLTAEHVVRSVSNFNEFIHEWEHWETFGDFPPWKQTRLSFLVLPNKWVKNTCKLAFSESIPWTNSLNLDKLLTTCELSNFSVCKVSDKLMQKAFSKLNVYFLDATPKLAAAAGDWIVFLWASEYELLSLGNWNLGNWRKLWTFITNWILFAQCQ